MTEVQSLEVDVEVALDAARARLHTAALARLAAETEYNEAETALYEQWQATFGSERYKAAKYSEDQQRIKAEVGATW